MAKVYILKNRDGDEFEFSTYKRKKDAIAMAKWKLAKEVGEELGEIVTDEPIRGGLVHVHRKWGYAQGCYWIIPREIF